MDSGRRLLLAAVVLALASPAFASSTIVLVNNNAPGVGLNDPTPVAPVGGNPGTTLGQQRLNVFQRAADLWAAELDSPATITVLASMEPLACTATTATLGSAGARFIFSDFGSVSPFFPGAEFPNVWYRSALAGQPARRRGHSEPHSGSARRKSSEHRHQSPLQFGDGQARMPDRQLLVLRPRYQRASGAEQPAGGAPASDRRRARVPAVRQHQYRRADRRARRHLRAASPSSTRPSG